MKKVSLNENWELTFENICWGAEMAPAVLNKTSGWLPCDIPCDIHAPLIEAGVIREPLEALNCYDCVWTEEKSWWFKKGFTLDEGLVNAEKVELTMESLDAKADVFFNGFYIGHHISAFYPFVAEVKKFIHAGENTLLVRLTHGLEDVSAQDLAAFEKCISTEYEEARGDRGDKRRAMVRTPQFAYGWDWGPRVSTCGIMKDVYITAYNKIAIRSVRFLTKSAGQDAAEVEILAEIENLHIFKSFDGVVEAEFSLNGKYAAQCKAETHLRSGLNYIRLGVCIDHPELWWPNGMGEQPLYTVKLSAAAQGEKVVSPEIRFGIRTLKLNMDKIGDNERLFAFEVNGVKTFCKGANWIPADSVYGRIPDEKYEYLLREARDANFTMLRVWGGGLYEKDVFYNKCDEYGILVWHDFMFACSMYPDNLDWFCREAEAEIDYQTRRLRNHSCIALWSGCNENNEGFDDWWVGDKTAQFPGGAVIYNKIAPAVVERNCPEIPYWNGSPYGGLKPNSNEVGDRHHWGDCMMNEDMEKRITPEEYDKVTSKFISEYGYIGPCDKSSIIKYHCGQPVDRDGDIWDHHNNTFEKKTVAAGIAKHYAGGADLDLDSYLLYAGLCQGLMYQYSLEAIRITKNCWGSLFWMYDDCWGEVGWTIIDYYLRRKPAYYYVKRAFAPIKFILRSQDDMVRVMGINDTGTEAAFDAEYGYVSFDGKTRHTAFTSLRLPTFSRKIVFEFEKGPYDSDFGIYFIKPSSAAADPAVLRQNVFKNLHVAKTEVRLSRLQIYGDSVSFTVSADAFAHAVHFNLSGELRLSDDYFDLLPGEEKRIQAYGLPEGFKPEDLKALSVTVR